MKKLLFIFLAVLVFGCKSSKIITEIRTETKWRDTTIYVTDTLLIDKLIPVPIPSFKDSIRIKDSLRIIDNQIASKSINKEIGIIGVNVFLHGNKIDIKAYLTDSVIWYRYIDKIPYSDSIKIYNAIKETMTNTTNTEILPPERYVPKFYKFTFWFFILFVLLVAGFIAWKINGGIYLQKIIALKNKIRGST